MKRMLIAIMLTTVLCAGCSAALPPVSTPAPTDPPDAANVDFVMELTPAPTPVPTPEATPTPVPTPAPDSFSVVWIADTQFITSLYPDSLSRMMQWAADSAEEHKTRLLVHTGDIVNDFESRRQWESAGAAFALLSGKVPFLAVCGNHDVGTSTLTYTRFKQHIASLYPDASTLYAGGRGNYALVETDEIKLLFVGIGWGYNDEAVAYLNQVLSKYPDYVAVLVLHSFLDPNGQRTDGGDIIFEKVIKQNKNVRFVLCGHRNGAAYTATDMDDGRTVHQLLYNYQEERSSEGGGYLRIVTFTPSLKRVEVKTYSPVLGDWMTDASASFTIDDAW